MLLHNPDWAQSVTAYEAVAQVIRIYQGQYIPPPFQTEDYARALLLDRHFRTGGLFELMLWYARNGP